MKRLVPFTCLVLAGCTSLEPAYVQPEPAVPASWPVGDPYLRQAEAALPAVGYADIFRDPRLQAPVQQGLANNRADDGGGQYRRGARAISYSAR